MKSISNFVLHKILGKGDEEQRDSSTNGQNATETRLPRSSREGKDDSEQWRDVLYLEYIPTLHLTPFLYDSCYVGLLHLM